jgi:hypothetical protein
MKTIAYAAAILYLTAFPCLTAQCQEPGSVPTLFRQLTEANSTDQALKQLLILGSGNPEVRAYLVANLPQQILAGPSEQPQPWFNEISLSGSLHLAEAIPSLMRWLDSPISPGGASTLTSRERLDQYPAGKALAQIGEPSIDALATVLETGSVRARWVSIRALNIIGTGRAIQNLADHLSRESNPGLKSDIQRFLEVRHAAGG